MLIFSVLDPKYSFSANLVPKIKIVSLSWNLVPRLDYWMRTLKTLDPLGLNTESAVLHYICQVRVFVQLFWTRLFLDLELWIRLWSYVYFVFVLHPWSQFTHRLETIRSIISASQLIGFCVIWTLWSKFIVLILFLIHFIVVVLVLLCILLFCQLSALCFYWNLIIDLLTLLCIYFCSYLVC